MLFLRPAMLRDTAGESLIPDFVTVTADVFLTPPSFGHLPYILLRKTPRNATGHGRGGG